MPSEIYFKPVLSQIRLKNFKSVKDAKVDLKLLTVVVGKNSSGKSTLLQSILVLSQAVLKRGRSRYFPLNGEFVKLGSFSEVKNFSNDDDLGEILLGFTLNRPKIDLRNHKDPKTRISRALIRDQNYRSYSWDGHISRPQNQSNGFASIDALELAIETFASDIRTELLNVDISKILNEIEVEGSGELFNPLDPKEIPLGLGETVQKVDGRVHDGVSGQSSSIDVASLSGGLPDFLFRADSRLNSYAQIWWDQYSEILADELVACKNNFAEAIAQGEVIPKKGHAVTQAAEDIIGLTKPRAGENSKPETRGPFKFKRTRFLTREYFAVCAGRLSDDQKIKVAESMVSLQEATFRTELKRIKLKEPFWDEIVHTEFSGANGESLRNFNYMINSIFSRGVKYLGPLRQEPKPVYDPGPESDYLGIHGEFTAGVLLQRNVQLRKDNFPLPGGRNERCTFSEALIFWLSDFGLVEKASATDRGRLGIGLEVTPLGTTKSVDLTSVGVGVSQVLPVLVLCLISKPDNIMIIEQPELHLHPAMQLKLADFLLACARTGRQLIIETHSEHIVNRLRLRSMESPDENAKLIRLLFAEQENGNTVYRSSDVNELGGLDEDWPEGFLDVAANEATDFMRMSIEKLRQKNKLN